MSHISGLRVAINALTVRRPHPDVRHRSRSTGTPRGAPVPPVTHQRDTLAQVLYLAEQGFWSSGREPATPQGTAWGTSTERYLQSRYLDQADAILAAGFRQSPTFTRETVEEAHRTEGSTADPDDWIVVAWALGIDVDECG